MKYSYFTQLIYGMETITGCVRFSGHGEDQTAAAGKRLKTSNIFQFKASWRTKLCSVPGFSAVFTCTRQKCGRKTALRFHLNLNPLETLASTRRQQLMSQRWRPFPSLCVWLGSVVPICWVKTFFLSQGGRGRGVIGPPHEYEAATRPCWFTLQTPPAKHTPFFWWMWVRRRQSWKVLGVFSRCD